FSATLRDENIFSKHSVPCSKPLGSVSPVLRGGKVTEQTFIAARRIYSSTKAKMSVLYFFAMFVMFSEVV
ncbi:MAG TPA: hypothetical protein VGK56_04150, partial [Anaerolineales bacterium]